MTPLHDEVVFVAPVGDTADARFRPFRNQDGTLLFGPNARMRRLALRNADRLGSYQRADVRVTYSTRAHWEIYGEIINVFGRAAASVVLVMQWWEPARSPRAGNVQVGAVERVIGALTITSDDRVHVMAAAGTPVAEGDTLETAHASRAAVTLGRLSIRLDRQTAIEFTDYHRLLLRKGGVYIDTGARRAHHPLTIETPLGRVQHTGTQFEVRLEDVSLRIHVREGSVIVESDRARWAASGLRGWSFAKGAQSSDCASRRLMLIGAGRAISPLLFLWKVPRFRPSWTGSAANRDGGGSTNRLRSRHAPIASCCTGRSTASLHEMPLTRCSSHRD